METPFGQKLPSLPSSLVLTLIYLPSVSLALLHSLLHGLRSAVQRLFPHTRGHDHDSSDWVALYPQSPLILLVFFTFCLGFPSHCLVGLESI
jgi:hypothetical protein